jgi:predicted CoA-binding protein
MENLVKDFLKQKSFAVIGSFRNESKYAFRILRKLKKKGYEVYPVNPGLEAVDGLKCYKSVKDIPFTVDVANIVTPPKATEQIVRECKEKGVYRVWLQPGAESEEAINFCRQNKVSVIHNLCVMIEAT